MWLRGTKGRIEVTDIDCIVTAVAKNLVYVSCLVCALAVGAVLFLLDPAHVHVYPFCLFHRMTGLDCPGCGSLRAIHQLLHGHLAAAIRLNALLILSLPVFAWLGVRCVQSQTLGKPMPKFRPLWVWLYVAAWIVFGVVRNLEIHL